MRCSSMTGLFFVGLVLGAAVFAVSCGNPRQNAAPAKGPGIDQPTPPAPAPTGSVLAPRYTEGARVSATRSLSVREETEKGVVVTEAEEVTLTLVKRVDPKGRLLEVERTYERSRTRHGVGTPEEARGLLEGATLSLVRADAASPVTATVVRGDETLAGQKFLLDGFDAALLPSGLVAEGDVWNIEGTELAGLNAIIEGLGFRIEKNRLSCRLMALGENRAAVTLEWRVTGSFGQTPAVLEFSGLLEFHRKESLVSSFSLSGGRQGGGKSVEIRVSRQLQP